MGPQFEESLISDRSELAVESFEEMLNGQCKPTLWGPVQVGPADLFGALPHGDG